MAKSKTVPTAEKVAAPERQPVHVAAPEKKRFFSKDVKLEYGERTLTPPNRGPSTSERPIDDVRWLQLHASPEELRTFRASVQARLDHSKSAGWKRLPDNSLIRADRVLLACSSCKRWIWGGANWANSFCPRCNMANRTTGGQLRLASPAEEKAWFERETANRKKFAADRPKREAEQREFDKRYFADKGIGR
jgi:hypothetical protein